MSNSAQIMKPGDVSLGLSHHFIGAFGRAGGSQKMLQEAADNPSLMEKIVEIFGVAENASIRFTYDMSLASMIDAGKYDWKNKLFTEENFPKNGKGEVQMPHLHHFGRDISSEDAVKELDKLGLRSATFEELLFFGANNPEEQKKYPIVALDPARVFMYDGRRSVSGLSCGAYDRDLRLCLWDDGWHGRWRFAVVRK